MRHNWELSLSLWVILDLSATHHRHSWVHHLSRIYRDGLSEGHMWNGSGHWIGLRSEVLNHWDVLAASGLLLRHVRAIGNGLGIPLVFGLTVHLEVSSWLKLISLLLQRLTYARVCRGLCLRRVVVFSGLALKGWLWIYWVADRPLRTLFSVISLNNRWLRHALGEWSLIKI